MKAQKFIVKFPILGFEDVENVYFSEVDDGALAFLSLEGKEIELLLLNPYKVREYSFEIPLNIQTLLEIKSDTKVKVFCVFVRDKEIG
ncbi:MAG: flagellar assembly protein FliW, partial [Helicobacter sp.]|nr:flagellar assembly protein FliW [Helicobacter sp.]